jgi:hypothetical protein
MDSLAGRVDTIDVLMDKIRRSIEKGSRDDPEMAAGLGTGDSLGNVQRQIDRAAAACEALHYQVRDVIRAAA